MIIDPQEYNDNDKPIFTRRHHNRAAYHIAMNLVACLSSDDPHHWNEVDKCNACRVLAYHRASVISTTCFMFMLDNPTFNPDKFVDNVRETFKHYHPKSPWVEPKTSDR